MGVCKLFSKECGGRKGGRGHAARADLGEAFFAGLEGKDTRARLLDAARVLFWRYGYGPVSVDDICAISDVKKGSFYHFFESKNDLLRAAIEEDCAEFQAAMDRAFSPQHPPRRKLENFVALVVRDQEEARAMCGRVVGACYATIGSEVAVLDEGVARQINAFTEKLRLYFRSMIVELQAAREVDAAVAPDGLVQRMEVCCIGLLTQARMRNDLELLRTDMLPLLGAALGLKHDARGVSAA